jgi:hypothetical protein
LDLLQLVPRLPPARDGIGDHSLRLAERLRDLHNINTSFLVCDPNWTGSAEVNGFRVIKLEERTPHAFAQAMHEHFVASVSRGLSILLHFAPYAYQSRGFPLWLLRSLEVWKKQYSAPLMTMFHELEPGWGKPWSSTFWLHPLQRQLIRNLAKLSDIRLTNTAYYGEKLGIGKGRRVELTPTFSSIAEPVVNPVGHERANQILVFGRPWQRQLAYKEGAEALEYACRIIGAQKVIDIGAPIANHTVREISGVPIVECGSLPSAEVSLWMHSSLASFVYYPEALLTKSSVYAASCAHGTVPFVAYAGPASLRISELEAGLDYISISQTTTVPGLNLAGVQDLSRTVYERYKNRSSFAAAELISDLMSSPSSDEPSSNQNLY